MVKKKTKPWIWYLLYLVIIIVYVIIKSTVTEIVAEDFNRNFRLNLSLYTMVFLMNIGFGLLLGFEHLLREWHKRGNIKINRSKIIFLGVPSIYFSIVYYFAYSGNQFLSNNLARPIYALFNMDDNFIPLFQIILGYILITCFYKNPETINEEITKEEIDPLQK
ncbi:MAG: hypothetical protein WBI07_21530 [Mobilitalea sp.]